MTRFGRQTLVKFVGGQLIARDAGVPVEKMRSDMKGIRRRALDLTKPFNDFMDVWFRQERRVFAAEGIPRWRQLQPPYAAWKLRHYPGMPIMQRSQATFRSLTGRTTDTIFEARPRSLRIGTRLPQSAYNQAERPHVVILSETFRQMSRMTLNYILQGGGR